MGQEKWKVASKGVSIFRIRGEDSITVDIPVVLTVKKGSNASFNVTIKCGSELVKGTVELIGRRYIVKGLSHPLFSVREVNEAIEEAVSVLSADNR